ncbi:MAG: T9SS type A sorting domain-containing protein, partial [Saprospiraceae bacterium]|nr:T9SS type A sorting domain-containing protein [Saprospiraceae bacterium]
DYKTSGSHSVIFNASGLSTGVYIYSLIAGNKALSKKLILLK